MNSKANSTFSSFTVEDDLLSESSFASVTRISGFPSSMPYSNSVQQKKLSAKRQQEIQERARQEFYRDQTGKMVDPFAHRLASGFAGSEEEIYAREKERLERQIKKKDEERMTGATSYTIVFHDKRGPPVIQPPADPNVFKMCANKMLDEQGDHQDYVVKKPPKKVQPKPIESIQQSDNDSDGDAYKSVEKWKPKPKSNNYLANPPKSSGSINAGRSSLSNAPSSPKASMSVKMPSKVPPALIKKQSKQPEQNPNKSGTTGGNNNSNPSRPPPKQPQKAPSKKDSAEKPQKKFSEVYQGQDRGLVEQLERELVECPTIGFDDIADLETAKNLLQEAVLLPRLMPEFFQGIRRATKGVMLFGPPGTGKTLLAKAVSKGNIFFNVSASSLASKWKGQSQKLVRLLFEMAKHYAPSVVFFDEIDAIGSKRSEDQNESNRKVKSELLVQMDGASATPQKQVFVLAATNRPWDIDEALRRRLQKRIYIPLPSAQGRKKMFQINLKGLKLQEHIDWSKLVKMTKDYSGADIAIVCREAAYMPMRKRLAKLGGIGKISEVKELQKQLDIALTESDFLEAIKNVNKSVGNSDLKKYEEWMKEFGSS